MAFYASMQVRFTNVIVGMCQINSINSILIVRLYRHTRITLGNAKTYIHIRISM